MTDSSQPDRAAEIREALASGKAHLRYIKTRETWYYLKDATPLDRWVTDEIGVGINSDDGGTFGEWTIALGNLGQRNPRFAGPRSSYPAVQHRVFDDALPAVLAVPDYWQVMQAAGSDPEAVEHALIALGFVDKTERVRPTR